MASNWIDVWVALADDEGYVSESMKLPMEEESNWIDLPVALRELSTEWSHFLDVYASLEDFQANAKLKHDVVIPGVFGRDRDTPVVVVLYWDLRERQRIRGGPVRASAWFATNSIEQVTQAETTVRYLLMVGFPLLAHPSPHNTIVLERACYVTIFDQIKEIIRSDPSVRNMHVTGNRGIGKSRFYVYCIFRLALDEDVRRQLPNFQLVLNFQRRYHTFDPVRRWFASVTSLTEIDELRRSLHVVRLVEHDSDLLGGWSGVSVLFSIPAMTSIHSFLEDHGQSFVMPTWSLSELQALNRMSSLERLPMDETTLVDLFYVRGGVPRSIFSKEEAVFDIELREALGNNDLINLVAGGASGWVDTFHGRLLAMVPTRADYVKTYRLEFLSSYIADRVATKLLKAHPVELAALFARGV